MGRVFRADRAENSIMQTITIAVIAITIGAGMVSMPKLVENLRKQSLSVDISNVAHAQDFNFAQDGAYIPNSQLLTLTDGTTPVKVTVSDGVQIGMTTARGGYLIVGQTKSVPALVKDVGGVVVTPGVSGFYEYRSSNCDTVWIGTQTYGVVLTGQAQDPTNSVVKKGVVKCKALPVIPVTKPAMTAFTPNSYGTAPAGSHWVY